MDYKATLFHANIAVKLFEFEIISPMPLRLFEQDPRRMRATVRRQSRAVHKASADVLLIGVRISRTIPHADRTRV